MEVSKIDIYKKGIGNQFVDPEFQEMMKAQIAILEKGPEKPTFNVGDHVKYRAGEPSFWMYGVITNYDGDGFYRVDAYGVDPEHGAFHDEAKRNQKNQVQLSPLKDFMLYNIAKSTYEKEIEPYKKKYPTGPSTVKESPIKVEKETAPESTPPADDDTKILASRLRLLEKMIAKDPENTVLKTRKRLLEKRLKK